MKKQVDPKPSGQKRVRNIAELAAIAGVTPATISRALSGKGMIAAKTRQRIQALAAEYNFRPNATARNLRSQRSGAIQVVIPLGHEKDQHLSDPFFMTMLGHLADGLTERGYELILSRIIPQSADWLDQIIDLGRSDGVIVVGQSNQAENLDRVADYYRSLVVWGGFNPGQRHCSVGSDNFLGGALATDHLIDRGCRRIAFFGDPTPTEIKQRLDGCKAAIQGKRIAHPLTILPAHLAEGADSDAIIAFWRDQNAKPDGIVAASDVIAVNALLALAAVGVTAPGQVRVVGYDDLPIALQTTPKLTTIRQDFGAGAKALIDTLFKRMSGEATASIVMKPELVIRGSA